MHIENIKLILHPPVEKLSDDAVLVLLKQVSRIFSLLSPILSLSPNVRCIVVAENPFSTLIKICFSLYVREYKVMVDE